METEEWESPPASDEELVVFALSAQPWREEVKKNEEMIRAKFDGISQLRYYGDLYSQRTEIAGFTWKLKIAHYLCWFQFYLFGEKDEDDVEWSRSVSVDFEIISQSSGDVVYLKKLVCTVNQAEKFILIDEIKGDKLTNFKHGDSILVAASVRVLPAAEKHDQTLLPDGSPTGSWADENRDRRQENGENMGKYRGFLDAAAQMRCTLAQYEECKQLLDDLRKLDGDLNGQEKEVDRDAFMYIRYIISYACTIIVAAKEFTMAAKELALRVGLRGLTCALDETAESMAMQRTMEEIPVRICLKEFNILLHLADPSIYLYYSDCWKFLWHASECEFKIDIAAFPIVDAFKHIMSGTCDESQEEDQLILRYAKNFVEIMLEEGDEFISLSAFEQDDQMPITYTRMRKLELKIRVGLKKSAANIVKEMRQTLSSSDAQQRLFAQLKKWFDTRMAHEFNLTYDEMDARIKKACEQIAYEVASTEIAIATAMELINCMDDWFTVTKESMKLLFEQQLFLLTMCAALAHQDDDLFLSLCEKSVVKLVALRKTVKNDDTNRKIEGILIILIEAELRRVEASTLQGHQLRRNEGIEESIVERILKIDYITSEWSEGGKVNNCTAFTKKESRLGQIENFGYIRLFCLENGIVSIAMNSLLELDSIRSSTDTPHNIHLGVFLFALFVGDIEYVEDRKIYVDLIMKQRREIIRVIGKLVFDAANMLSDTTCDLEDGLNIIVMGCTLYTELLHCFNESELEDFYGAQSMEAECPKDNTHTPSFRSIIDALGAVYRNLFAKLPELRDSVEDSDLLQRTINSAVMSLLNASLTSGISQNSMLADEGYVKESLITASFDSVLEPGDLKILNDCEELAMLAGKEDRHHHFNVLRAAHILNLADPTLQPLTTQHTIISIVKETIESCAQDVRQKELDEEEMKHIVHDEWRHEHMTSGDMSSASQSAFSAAFQQETQMKNARQRAQPLDEQIKRLEEENVELSKQKQELERALSTLKQEKEQIQQLHDEMADKFSEAQEQNGRLNQENEQLKCQSIQLKELEKTKVRDLEVARPLLKFQEIEKLSKSITCTQLLIGAIVYFKKQKPFELYTLLYGNRKDAIVDCLQAESDCILRGSHDNLVQLFTINKRSVHIYSASLVNETFGDCKQINNLPTSEVFFFTFQPLYFIERSNAWSIYQYHESYEKDEGKKFDVSTCDPISQFEPYLHREILYLFRCHTTASVERVNEKVVKVEGPLLEIKRDESLKQCATSIYSSPHLNHIFIINSEHSLLLILNTASLTVSQMSYDPPPGNFDSHSIVGIHSGILTMTFGDILASAALPPHCDW